MSTHNTYKRPTLDRTAAVRHVATAYRRPEEQTRKKPRPGGPLTSTEDVVLEAVKLGYKIADEQIVKGQDFARRLRGASLRSDTNDMGSFVDQGLRLAKQFAILLVEMTETTAQAPAIIRKAATNASDGPVAQPGSAHEPAPARAGDHPSEAGYPVPVVVRSARRTRVTLVLYRKLVDATDVYPLYLKDKPRAAPLHGVKFDDENGWELVVDVPNEQDPGTYRGYAINPSDGKPVGTIEVVIEEK